MENTVDTLRAAHELVEALGGALQHEGDVAGIEADTLGFAGGAGGVDDGNEIGVAAGIRRGWGRLDRQGRVGEKVVEGGSRRLRCGADGPRLRYRIA